MPAGRRRVLRGLTAVSVGHGRRSYDRRLGAVRGGCHERNGAARTLAHTRRNRQNRFMNIVAGRPAAGVLAWSLAGLTVLTLAATLVLLGLDVRVISAGRILFYVLGTLALLLCTGIGRLIASRVPANAIGWLLGMIGLMLAVSLFTEQYALRGLAGAPGSLPAVRQIGALSGGLAQFSLILLVILVLLFPDGRLPSRRWRPVLWGTFVAIAGAAHRPGAEHLEAAWPQQALAQNPAQ